MKGSHSDGHVGGRRSDGLADCDGERIERIRALPDVYAVRQLVRELAATIGFDPKAQTELAIVASELASNILKYAGSGELRIRALVDTAGQPGLEIAAHDNGPLIADFQTALKDGWNADGPIDPPLLLGRGGIGTGLGAVSRFSDYLDYQPSQPSGKTIVARRFVRTQQPGQKPSPE